MTILYTPGFGPITDTLIAYGIAEGIIRAYPDIDFRIESIGDRLIIKTEENILPQELNSGLEDALEEMLDYSKSAKKSSGKVSFLDGIQIRFGEIKNVHKYLNELVKEGFKNVNIIEKYSKLEHKCEKEKGASAESLVITPQCGRYSSNLFKYKTPGLKIGKRCCYFLCYLGLHYYSLFINTGKKSTITGIIIPGYNFNQTEILCIKELATKIQWEYNILLNLPGFLLYRLSQGETLLPLDSLNKPWYIFIYRLESRGQGYTPGAFSQYNLNKILKFIVSSKSKSKNLLKIFKELLKHPEGCNSINLLGEALLFNNVSNFYISFRLMNKYLENNKFLLDEIIIKSAFLVGNLNK